MHSIRKITRRNSIYVEMTLEKQCTIEGNIRSGISNSKILYNHHHLRIKYRQSDSSFPHYHSLITFCPIVKHADRNHCLLLCCSHHHHLDCLPCPNCGHQNAPLGHLFGNLSLFPFLLHTAQNIQICFTMLLQ